MKAYEIIEKIEQFAPKSLACSWDNPGLLCGSADAEVKKILVALDLNAETAKEAAKENADMIISHHPVFLSGIKQIDFSKPEGEMIKVLIENKICAYAAHTNMDAAKDGINQRLAQMLELSDIKVLEPITESEGIGRFGYLKEETDALSLAKVIAEKLNTPSLRVSGGGKIKKLAICSGGGADYVDLAEKNGCEALLTGDIKYHNALSAAEKGICIIDGGHYPTEIIVCEIFEEILKNLPVEIIKSKQTDVFTTVLK